RWRGRRRRPKATIAPRRPGALFASRPCAAAPLQKCDRVLWPADCSGVLREVKNLQFDANREARLQYTIESRPLTSSPSLDGEPGQTTIDAASADDAITKFLHQSASELVSLTRPAKGSESI